MKTKLIVLVDFSSTSEPLVQLAANWAGVLGAEIVLVHKIPGLVPAMADSGIKEHILEMERTDALVNLTELKKKYIPEEVPVLFSITGQPLVYHLPMLKTRESINLVLLGLKGTGMLENVFIGSTATKVITELEEITVAVPRSVSHAVPEKLTIALNYHFPLNEQALDWLLRFFDGHLTEIHFLSVVTSNDEEETAEASLEKLHQKYNSGLPSSFSVLRGADLVEGLRASLAGNGKNILVVQKGSRSLTDRLFRRFFIDEIVNEGSIPLIVLPHE